MNIFQDVNLQILSRFSLCGDSVSVCFVCLSVAVCMLLLLHAAPKTRRLRVVLVLQQQKAARACDLRWFRPPLVDLTTENDSRIERIVRYDQDSDGDKMYKIQKRMRPQLLTTLVQQTRTHVSRPQSQQHRPTASERTEPRRSHAAF